mmetsp:Transcript_12022/g.26540  ORF Transcript_12022/g.26540 Transcript_12022/m.26540 type:complete len:250 (-) Transcript_12022:19-768(-)
MPGPIIEELPDDYDVAAEKSSSLRRGFFSKRETPKKVEKAPEVAESASPGAEPSTERSAEVDDMPEAPSQSSGPSMGQQLQNAIAGARGKLQEASRRASQEEKALEAALGPLQARWPTSQMKERQVKATKEIDNALAEMRMSLNDARRHRSGEERRALTELRKVAEDVVERVQKVADQASANHSKDAKELQQQTLVAFHALPFTVKLRILMAEKAVAVTLLGGAFTVGALVVLTISLEIFSAWACRVQC